MHSTIVHPYKDMRWERKWRLNMPVGYCFVRLRYGQVTFGNSFASSSVHLGDARQFLREQIRPSGKCCTLAVLMLEGLDLGRSPNSRYRLFTLHLSTAKKRTLWSKVQKSHCAATKVPYGVHYRVSTTSTRHASGGESARAERGAGAKPLSPVESYHERFFLQPKNRSNIFLDYPIIIIYLKGRRNYSDLFFTGQKTTPPHRFFVIETTPSICSLHSPAYENFSSGVGGLWKFELFKFEISDLTSNFWNSMVLVHVFLK